MLVSMVRSHSSMLQFFIRVKYMTPAQFTKMSIGPREDSVRDTRSRTD